MSHPLTGHILLAYLSGFICIGIPFSLLSASVWKRHFIGTLSPPDEYGKREYQPKKFLARAIFPATAFIGETDIMVLVLARWCLEKGMTVSYILLSSSLWPVRIAWSIFAALLLCVLLPIRRMFIGATDIRPTLPPPPLEPVLAPIPHPAVLR